MAKSTRKLDELAELLERTGGDPGRIEVVRRAQRFRRSWLDLAESLVKVRRERSHRAWGYEDFHDYCAAELTLKRATVDKLTLSFRTIESHAPEVLQWDGIARKVPSVEAVGYMARALEMPSDEADGGDDDDDGALAPGAKRARGAKLPPPRVGAPTVRELKAAVFDEGQPVAELRRRFDPEFFPRPAGSEQLATLRRASTLARRLAELLPDIEGLSETRSRRLEGELGKLRQELDTLIEPLKSKAG